MDISEELLGNCSPYIANLVYDIDVRMLFIECVDSPENQQPMLRLVFPDITSFSEENQLDAPDDDNMDDILEIYWEGDNQLCIETFKKAIHLQLTGEPFTETID